MTVNNSNSTSPWSKRIDRELGRAVEDQVIDKHTAEELSRRLAKSTVEVDRAVAVILGNR
jgi:hypothetical protein